VDVEVAIVGGGATGCGVAWDLAMRGVSVALVERGDIAGGTSGRYHGLLHSGARYAVTDPVTARECRKENAILRRIARPFINDTGGLFVLNPRDTGQYVGQWLSACRVAEIPARELTPGEALRREPNLDGGIVRAFEVPDAVCHSLPLCKALRERAQERGATFLTFHRLDGFVIEGGAVKGIRLTDLRSGEARGLSCGLVVSAAGPWSGEVAAMAGAPLVMSLTRGAMLAFDGTWTKAAINRLQPPDDGDIVLPRGRLSIAGTTTVVTDDPSDRRVEDWEVSLVRESAAALIPALAGAKVRHSWAAVRPLYEAASRRSSARADPRGVSRDFTVIEHGEPDGARGLVTIVGGKLTTFRLMAEKVSDAVCRILGRGAPCRTDSTEIGS
jgi:glycerol-3-phosphate dehydrogenase